MDPDAVIENMIPKAAAGTIEKMRTFDH